ncbi:hypothetical protein [Synechococcus sp. CCY 9618]|uniref:baeRF3 domain-containing protein n=1 Tax=Synechococcus sp. CCY 9618 TaxID=2815602 RepID=UPI001C24E183|nr:hypothetical protein [Synechococcus sp. CCY 9618]
MKTLEKSFTERLTQDLAEGLLENCDPPCLSLYQPTHRAHPDHQQDPLRFRNLVKELESSLAQQFTKEEIRPWLEPFLALADNHDFWNHTLDGLAVLGARGKIRVCRLQRPVGEMAIVADRFHIKPLLRILQSSDRFQVLALTRTAVRIFEGNRDAFDEIEPAPDVPRTPGEALGEERSDPHQTVASYGGVGAQQTAMHHGHGGRKSELDSATERFFRAVDQAVLEQHSRPSGLPLILAALPEHHHRFHAVSHNPFLISESVDIDPGNLESIEDLRQRAWLLLEPHHRARLGALAEEFHNARSQGRANDDPAQVAKAIVGGRVAKLLIEDGRQLAGRVDTATGQISLDDRMNPEVGDLLDDLGVLALKLGADVTILSREDMPTASGIAAINRY